MLTMKNQFFLLILLLFVITSCEEEGNPVSILEGSYEHSIETAYVSKTVMTFGNGGTVLVEYFRNYGEELGWCLTNYGSGTYTLNGEEFSVTLPAIYGPDPTALYRVGCIPKEELVNVTGDDPVVLEGTLVFGETRDTFTLNYNCDDLLSMCNATTMDFNKVE